MRKIFKYTIPVDNVSSIEIKGFHQIVDINRQHNDICVWAIVDDEEDHFRKLNFAVVPTGRPIPETFLDDTFLKTVHFVDGQQHLVFHVFMKAFRLKGIKL